jgi:hypothetical protein
VVFVMPGSIGTTPGHRGQVLATRPW